MKRAHIIWAAIAAFAYSVSLAEGFREFTEKPLLKSFAYELRERGWNVEGAYQGETWWVRNVDRNVTFGRARSFIWTLNPDGRVVVSNIPESESFGAAVNGVHGVALQSLNRLTPALGLGVFGALPPWTWDGDRWQAPSRPLPNVEATTLSGSVLRWEGEWPAEMEWLDRDQQRRSSVTYSNGVPVYFALSVGGNTNHYLIRKWETGPETLPEEGYTPEFLGIAVNRDNLLIYTNDILQSVKPDNSLDVVGYADSGKNPKKADLKLLPLVILAAFVAVAAVCFGLRKR